MSIEVIYQGLTIAKGPGFRLQDGGVFVELDGPMPVATQLSLVHGENALHGRVRRVIEGTGAGMLIVPTASQKLPRWLVPLGPLSVTNVELEPEPTAAAAEPTTAPAAAAESPVASIRVGEPDPSGASAAETPAETPVATIRVGEPDPSGANTAAETPASDPVKAAESPATPAAEAGASADAGEAGEVAAASGHTPSEPGDAAKDDDEDDKQAAKPTDKKTPAASTAGKKKKPRKR